MPRRSTFEPRCGRTSESPVPPEQAVVQPKVAPLVWQPSQMFNELAKQHLHEALHWAREALVWKLDGLSEYDIRRPLTATGTNLLGLVKHTATWEVKYFGDVFGRPFTERLPAWQDLDGSDLWVTEDESRAQIIDLYRRASVHADTTIRSLPIDAPGHVPWWPRPDVTLFSIMLHVLNDTTRHAGHADILREQLDGRTGVAAGQQEQIDNVARAAHRAKVERAARSAFRGLT
jgi:hypothetical protein